MAINEIPLSIDYTSRDYYAIRQELIDRIKTRIPDWTGSDSADFAVALVEAFAYMGDLSNYYIDRIANEAFIATATQRESLLAIAETYGYSPSGYDNAIGAVTFSNNATSILTIPAGTRVSGSVTTQDAVEQLTFTTTETAVVPAYTSAPGTISVGVYEGGSNVVESLSPYGASLGSSSGEATQSFLLPEFPVVQSTVKVYIQSGNTYKQWTNVKHLLDYGPNDTVFSTRLDADNNVYVDFGDGISGSIPTLYADIRCSYVVGGGVVGNVPALTISSLTYVPTTTTSQFPGITESQLASLNGLVTVTNQSTLLGGRDPDTNDQIRFLAPTYLRAQNRAVTLDDLINLSLNVSDYVGKANAVGTSWTSVTLYLAPKRDNNDGDPTPGVDGTTGLATTEWNLMKTAVADYLSDKLLVNTTVTYVVPTYVPVTIGLEYTLDPVYQQTDAEKNIKNAITYNFSYNFTPFGLTFTAQDIEFVLKQVLGVKTAKVTVLYKTGGSSGLTAVSALPNEIITVAETNVIITKV